MKAKAANANDGSSDEASAKSDDGGPDMFSAAGVAAE
jgi:hypothetical protein